MTRHTDDWVELERRHGTLASYKTDRCRCTPCRNANARYIQDRRAAGLEPMPSGHQLRMRAAQRRRETRA
jgi:hypothetical protein